MSDVVNALVKLLALEPLEKNLFRGQSQDLGWGQVFGGQVVGQALSAATQTVPTNRPVHSFHSYFLLTGKVDRPIVYDVDRIRDGHSFTTRRVLAIQDGEAIFSMEASFQVKEPGFDHQADPPNAPGPDELASQVELAQRLGHRIPSPLREKFTVQGPFDIRPVENVNMLAPQPHPPRNAFWVRALGQLPDDPTLHRNLLAYASDFNLLSAAMYPHATNWLTPGMQVASIDHAMWFHRPFRMDEWLLQVVDSPSASGGRGLARAQYFTESGVLVASATQEGLIRRREV